MTDLVALTDLLRCPVTGQSLALVEGDANWVPLPRRAGAPKPIGVGSDVDAMALLVKDRSAAYPVVKGIPVLLGPERLVPADIASTHEAVDLSVPEYAEAYEEMDYYNDPTSSLSYDSIMGALTLHRSQVASFGTTFPHPARIWVDAPHDSLSQLEGYAHLSPVAGKRVLQIGGSGSHAVKMLLAGARHAVLVTPMLHEALYATGLAAEWGVQDNFLAVLGVGEELPLAEASVDVAYSGGCFHHMRFDFLGQQLHRVLAPGGKFAGGDPYSTLLHSIGTGLLGKREASVHCRPVTPERLAKLRKTFPGLKANCHGPLLRYFFLGLEKMTRGRLRLGVPVMMRVMRFDDLIGRIVAPLGVRGGSVTICGVKQTGDLGELAA